MPGKTVSVSRVISSPIIRVWQAWTDPDNLKHWFTAEHGKQTQVIKFDDKPGGKVRLKFPGAAGEYTWTWVKIDKPRLLVFDILDFSLAAFPKGNGGICNIEFEDLNGKTKLTVWGELPEDMDNETMRKMAVRGWGGTLNRLDNYLKDI